MSLIKKLFNYTSLSRDIVNIISTIIYKSNYLQCIREYFTKLYGNDHKNDIYKCGACDYIGEWDEINIVCKIDNKEFTSIKLCDDCFLIENKTGNDVYTTRAIDDIDFLRDVKTSKIFGIKLPISISKQVAKEYDIDKKNLSKCRYWSWQ